MKAEIRLIYPLPVEDEFGIRGDATPDYVEEIEVSCVAELSNCGHGLLKQTGAEVVNFNFLGDKK